MPEQHRALDWLARRHAGESAALVASRAGVSETTVIKATKTYGPFPRPSQQLGRTTVSDEDHSERVRVWIEQRRRGRTATEIAKEDPGLIWIEDGITDADRMEAREACADAINAGQG